VAVRRLSIALLDEPGQAPHVLKRLGGRQSTGLAAANAASKLMPRPSLWTRSGQCDTHLENVHLSSYTGCMRRKEGAVLPIEESILTAALALRRTGQREFHGFAIAKELQDRQGARRLTAHGTLYKALNRMETAGLLISRWEDASEAAKANRPRRRLYKVTGAGEAAVAAADPSVPKQRSFSPRVAGS
jgi:PadR family transcriptional regulator PadR